MLIPVIRVRDKMTGYTRIVGSNTHDMLIVEPSHLRYYNLQNGCGTLEAYEFLPQDDYDPAEWWNDPHVEMVTLEEWLKLSEAEIKEAAQAKIDFYHAISKHWNEMVADAQEETGITGDSGGEILG